MSYCLTVAAYFDVTMENCYYLWNLTRQATCILEKKLKNELKEIFTHDIHLFLHFAIPQPHLGADTMWSSLFRMEKGVYLLKITSTVVTVSWRLFFGRGYKRISMK